MASSRMPRLKLVESNVPMVRMPGSEQQARRSFARLVIAGPCDLGGVARPVASCLVYPSGGSGGVQVEQVSEDSGGELRGEVDEGGTSSGLGWDAESAEAIGEVLGGDRAAG